MRNVCMAFLLILLQPHKSPRSCIYLCEQPILIWSGFQIGNKATSGVLDFRQVYLVKKEGFVFSRETLECDPSLKQRKTIFDDLSKTAGQSVVVRHKSSAAVSVWCVFPWLPSNSPLHHQPALPNTQPGTRRALPQSSCWAEESRQKRHPNAPGRPGAEQQQHGRNELKWQRSEDKEICNSVTGRSLTGSRNSAPTIRIFGLHARPAASEDPETVKHCPAFPPPEKQGMEGFTSRQGRWVIL